MRLSDEQIAEIRERNTIICREGGRRTGVTVGYECFNYDIRDLLSHIESQDERIRGLEQKLLRWSAMYCSSGEATYPPEE